MTLFKSAGIVAGSVVRKNHSLNKVLFGIIAAVALSIQAPAMAATYQYTGVPYAISFDGYGIGIGDNMTGEMTISGNTSALTGNYNIGNLSILSLQLTSGTQTINLSAFDSLSQFGFTNGKIISWNLSGLAISGLAFSSLGDPTNAGGDSVATDDQVTVGIAGQGTWASPAQELGGGPIDLGSTPLPSTWLMLLSGFVGLGFFAHRGSKKRTALVAA